MRLILGNYLLVSKSFLYYTQCNVVKIDLGLDLSLNDPDVEEWRYRRWCRIVDIKQIRKENIHKIIIHKKKCAVILKNHFWFSWWYIHGVFGEESSFRYRKTTAFIIWTKRHDKRKGVGEYNWKKTVVTSKE